jgi:hypothetical protein
VGRGGDGEGLENSLILPGGRNSGQRAQKGPGGKSWPNSGQIFPKVAEKGPKRIFFKSSLF